MGGAVYWYNGGCVGCVYPFPEIFNHSPWLAHTHAVPFFYHSILKIYIFFCSFNHLKVLITPRSQFIAASLGLVPWYNGGCVGCVYPFSQIFNHSPWLAHTCLLSFFPPFNFKNSYFFCYSNHLKVLITPRSQFMAASMGLVPWYNGGCVGCVYPFS